MKTILDKFLNSINLDRKIVLITLIFECFIKNTPQIKLGNYPIYIVCVLSFIVLIKRLVFNRHSIFGKRHLFSYLFILSLIITSVFNKAILNYNNLVLLIIFIIMFFIVSVIDYGENKNEVIDEISLIARITTFLHFAYSLAAIISSFIAKDYEIKGLLGYSYFYSYNSVTVIGLSLFLFFNENNNVLKYFQLLNLLLHLIIVFFTRARASYLGIFVALIFIIYILMTNKIKGLDYKSIKKYLLSFIVVSVVLTLLLSFITNFSIMKVLTKVFTTKNILSWRDIIWDAAFLAFMTCNMFLGTSIGLLPSFLSNYIDNVYVNNLTYDVYDKRAYDSALGIAKAGYLHNIFIQQLCSYGIFGLLIMLAYIYDNIKKYIFIIRSKIKDQKILILMICFTFTFIAQIIISFFDDNLFYNIVYICNVFFFYSIGVIDYFVMNYITK